MFPRSSKLFTKKLQTLAHFVKKEEKSSIFPKLATFRANCHVSAFWSTFQQKVSKNGSFREKARKIIDLAKTCNLELTTMFRRFGQLFSKEWVIP